jgi:autotransporter-associated beta strand protein
MRRRFALSAAACLTLMAQGTQAGNSWIGGGTDNLWGNPNNWSPYGNPGSGSLNDLFFNNTNGNYTSVNNYNYWAAWRDLYFNPGGAFTLASQSGCNLDLYGKIENASPYTVSVSFADIALQADAQFNPVNGSLSVSASHIYTNGYSLSVIGNDTRWTNFLSGTDITGTGKLRINGPTVDLQGANSYAGNTEIDAGYLQIHGSINSSSNIYLGNGGASYGNRWAYLQLYNASQPLTNHIIINKADTGTGIGTGIRQIRSYQSSAAMVLSGGIAINGDLQFANMQSSGSINVTGDIVNGSDNSANTSHNVTVNFGKVRLGGNNSYTGNTTVGTTNGTLEVGSANAIPFGTGKGSVNLYGTLDLHGFDVNVNGLWANNATATVDNLDSAATGSCLLTVGNGDVSGGGIFNGTIKNTYGTLSVRKVGTGLWAFYGAKTYSGDTTVDAGTMSLGGADPLPHGAGKGNVYVNGTGVLNLNAAPNTTINGLWGNGVLNNLSGPSTYTLTVGDNDQSSTFSGKIQNSNGSVSLTKTGAGTLTLSGDNSYKGATTINSGTLLVHGTHSGMGATTVNSGATLGGTGTLSSSVTINAGGVVAPGTSVGTLWTGPLNIAGTYLAEIALDASAADRIDVTGSVTLTNATLKFVFVSSSPTSTPQTVVVIRNDGTDPVSGTFASFDAPAWVSYSMNYAYNGDGGSVGNDVAVTFTHVPEPTAAVLLAGGGLLLRRTRIRRS